MEDAVFELEIERVRTTYKARVRQSPAGPGGKSSFSAREVGWLEGTLAEE